MWSPLRPHLPSLDGPTSGWTPREPPTPGLEPGLPEDLPGALGHAAAVRGSSSRPRAGHHIQQGHGIVAGHLGVGHGAGQPQGESPGPDRGYQPWHDANTHLAEKRAGHRGWSPGGRPQCQPSRVLGAPSASLDCLVPDWHYHSHILDKQSQGCSQRPPSCKVSSRYPGSKTASHATHNPQTGPSQPRAHRPAGGRCSGC